MSMTKRMQVVQYVHESMDGSVCHRTNQLPSTDPSKLRGERKKAAEKREENWRNVQAS